MEGFKGNELVFHNEGGVVKAGGYIINSKILQSGGAAIKNLSVKSGGVSKEIAVPAGLFLIHEKNNKMDVNLNIDNHVDEIGGSVNNSVFDRFFKLVGGKKIKNKKTKGRRRRKNKKTRKKKK